ncbi:MAG TPA: sortase [Coriobacteriia bacterium]
MIPRIAVDAGISEGNIDAALDSGVYHYPETAAPGEAGNAVIAGHRLRRAFTLLHVLKKGDPVIVYWHGREYDYRVMVVFEVDPSDTAILERGSQELLTLYTCLPRTVGDRRTVVIAEPALR